MQQSMLQKTYSGESGGSLGWPGMESGGGPPPGQPGLSVVATVWGVTPGTQMSSQYVPAGYHDNMSMYQRGHSVGQMQQASQSPAYSQIPMSNNAYYRQNSITPITGPTTHYRPSYSSAMNGNPEYQPPPGALSAAAMVAAAATATATATATASMMVQQEHYPQQQSSQIASHMPPQYNPAYSNQRIPGMMISRDSSVQMAGGPMPSQQALVYRRPSPYAHPAMVQRKQTFSSNIGAPGAGMTNTPYSSLPAQHTGFPNQINHQIPPAYPNSGRMPSQNMMMSGSPPSAVATCHTRAQSPYVSGVMPYMTAGHPNVVTPHQISNQSGYQNGYASNISTVQDIKPVVSSHPGEDVNDLKLTFPIRDGVLLPPFRLEHNLTVSHHQFELKEHVFQTLMERQDLELQLKCFHHEDRNQMPNWPASVSVSINHNPLLVDRGEQRTYNKPLYLKGFCVAGSNTITITVRACCCSHLFLLQLIHRPTIQSVLVALLKKNLLPGEKCINKIKRNFASGGMNSVDTEGVEQMSVKVSLKCPITFHHINLPARGTECCHIQCFDLESYLKMNSERGLWRCPVCRNSAPLDGLEIDQYMWGIIDQLRKTADEINIDANAKYVPVSMVKEEDKSEVCALQNSWMKVYSPSSTNLPSVGSYEGHHNPTSPYPTPPNSHNSQGSNSVAHFNGGLYDVAFNSPPDFSGPMSNRSDVSENEKRMGKAVLHRQQSGISSPQGLSANPAVNSGANNPYLVAGGPASNAPTAPPLSNTPMSQGPPSNAPASQGPPSNAPLSHSGPPSNAPVSNHASSAAELSADISDLVQNTASDNPLDIIDDQDLLPYLGPQDTSSSNSDNYDDLLSILTGS